MWIRQCDMRWMENCVQEGRHCGSHVLVLCGRAKSENYSGKKDFLNRISMQGVDLRRDFNMEGFDKYPANFDP